MLSLPMHMCKDGATACQQMQVTDTPQRSPSSALHGKLQTEALGKY